MTWVSEQLRTDILNAALNGDPISFPTLWLATEAATDSSYFDRREMLADEWTVEVEAGSLGATIRAYNTDPLYVGYSENPATTAEGFSLYDAATGGTLVFWMPFAAPIAVPANTLLRIPAGNLNIRITDSTTPTAPSPQV